MKQKIGIKTNLTAAIIYIIANFIFLSYGRVIVELYRNLLLLFLPPVTCILTVLWLARKNKISLKAPADLNSFQTRLFMVTGFAIGNFLIFLAMYFFLA